jgi:hypothetical protein
MLNINLNTKEFLPDFNEKQKNKQAPTPLIRGAA